MKKVYKLPPCSIYDVPAMETWLSDLARAGLHLQKAYRWHLAFQKGEASDACYRLEPVMNTGSTVPAAEMQECYEQAGWKFVTVIPRSFFIWRRIRADADELHSDPVIHSTAYEPLLKRMKTEAVISAVFPVFLLAILLGGMLLSRQPVKIFLASPSLPLLTAAEFLFGIQAVQQTLNLSGLKRSLADGFPAAHQKNYRKGLRLHLALNIITAIPVILILAMPVCMLVLDWEKTVSETDTVLPYLPLDIIEQDSGFSWHKDTYMKNGIDQFNRASYTWTPFVPVHYDIYQQGEVQNVYKDEHTVAAAPSSKTEYFRLLFPSFAVPLYQELVQNYTQNHTDSVITEYSHPGFDLVSISSSDKFSQLFACKDRQVIHIQYWGNADLAEKLDLLAEKLL